MANKALLASATLMYILLLLGGCVSNAASHPAAGPSPLQCPACEKANASALPCFASNRSVESVGALHSPSDAELGSIINDFDAYAQKARADWNVSGMSIAIVRGDQVLFLKGYGTKAVNASDPVTPDTIFQMASTSKAFTSTLVGMEVDRGALRWDDKVNDYLPDFRMNDSWVTDQMTLSDTMAHHSGLPEYWGDVLLYLGYDGNYTYRTLRNAQPVTSFRTKYAYQNVIYSLPTRVVGKITNKSWPDNLHEMIFAPLGMDNTTADLGSFMASNDKAVPYMYADKADGALIPDEIPADSIMNPMGYQEPGAGGINSNARDMAKWMIFQMGNGSYQGRQLISSDSLNYVHSPKTPLSGTVPNLYFYSQGWIYGDSQFGPVLSHSGAINGFHTSVMLLPKEKTGIVILTNNIESNLADALDLQFVFMYFGNNTTDASADMLKAFKAQRADPATRPAIIPANPALSLSAYAGNYTEAVYGTAVVAMDGSNLSLTLGPAEVKLTLVPIGGNQFAHLGSTTDAFVFGHTPIEFGVRTKTAMNMTLQLSNGNVTFMRD